MTRRISARLLLLGVGAWLAAGGRLSGGEGDQGPRMLIDDPAVRHTVVLGARRAAARLTRPECRAVLEDFPNWPGRWFESQLEVDGVSMADYVLSRIWFVDGRDTAVCRQARPPAAFTGVGQKVVHVCPSALARLGHHMTAVEALFIHEALHTLGLPENPPSSAEITRRVKRRCR